MSTRKLLETLQAAPPESPEFHEAAADYFGQRTRSHRNYGRFFVLLATLSWALGWMLRGQWKLFLLMLPGFLFFGFMGWSIINGANRTLRVLHESSHADTASRLRQLRLIALSYRGDPVSTLVIKATERYAS